MPYKIARKVHTPGGSQAGVPADWFVEFADTSHPSGHAHYIIVQFGSIGVSEAEANDIAARMLSGLNGGWRIIADNPPKDGTKVLLLAGEPIVGYWSRDDWHGEPFGWTSDGGDRISATHWAERPPMERG